MCTSGHMGKMLYKCDHCEKVNLVALRFSVPHTTLKDRISGRVIHGTNELT